MKLKKLTVKVLDDARASHFANYQRTNQGLAAQRFIYLLFAGIFAASERRHKPCGDALKYEWLSSADYQDKENLFCQIRLALTAVGSRLFIRFSKFRHTLP